MKHFLLFMVLCTTVCSAQWTTTGNNIYNSNSGYVGIGTTTPAARLHVSDGGFRHGGTGEINVDAVGVIGGRFKITDNGFVGIGASNPLARLHVKDGYLLMGDKTFDGIFARLDGTDIPSLRLTRWTGGNSIQHNAFIGQFYNSAVNNEYSLGIGTGASQDGNYYTTSMAMTFLLSGNVGVGLTNPGQKLEVNGNIGVGANEGALTGWGSKLIFQGADSNNDPLCLSRYNLGSNSSELRMIIGDDAGGEDAFVVGNTFYGDGQWKTFLKVRNDGNVGIGTSAPDAKLAVRGTVHANEVKVDLNVQGPDYVFEPTYALPSLDSVQSYISQNKHLPEVPSAKEMEANGVNLGEMNMLLLKKVEELTLYMIELKKENRLEKEDNEKLRETLNLLINEVTTIKDHNK